MKRIAWVILLLLVCAGGVNAQKKSNAGVQLQVIEEAKVPDDYKLGIVCSYALKETGTPVLYEKGKKEAVIMVDGKLVKLKWDKQHKAYSNGNYTVQISTKNMTGKGYDGTELKGTLTITDKKGNKTKMTIWGGCEA